VHDAGLNVSFLSPQVLCLLVLVPLLAAAWGARWFLRGDRMRWPGLRSHAAAPSAWRHAPAVLFGLGLAAVIVAAARPTVVVALPMQQQTIVLAMDVSASMRADDVKPTRLAASQQAAKAFVAGLPGDVRVGVVTYGAIASVVQQPTRNRSEIVDAIDHFRLQPGTAIGNGLVYALAALLPDSGIDADRFDDARRTAGRSSRARSGDERRVAAAPRPGSYPYGMIVLLSDGQNTAGVPPLDAAHLAAEQGVKVFTVGFGTSEGTTISFGSWEIRVHLDEATLRSVAEMTGGKYFHAATGPELDAAYRSMSSRFALEKRETEITALFAAAGALLLMLGAGWAIAWFGRML
jgi:Ca-activated chloride channel family protein